MQALVPSYLEFSMENLAREQQKLREQMAQAFGPAAAFQAMEDDVRTNMSFFTEAMRMFSPFAPAGTAPDTPPGESALCRPGPDERL